MTPIHLFGFPGSTYVRTARAICIEKGVPHELAPLDFRGESHRARHPFLKMPAMEHDGVALFETLAIAIYVDGLRAAPALQPAEPRARAAMMQWISAAIDYLYRDLVAALLAGASAETAANVARDLDVLERALTDAPYLAGRELTLADLFVVPMVDFAAKKDARFAPAHRHSVARWLAVVGGRDSLRATAT